MSDKKIDFSGYVKAGKQISKIDTSFAMMGLKVDSSWCRVTYYAHDVWNMKTHSHSVYEMQVGLNGECEFEVGNETILLKPGEFFVIPPKKAHRIVRASEDFSKFVWSFKLSSVAPESKYIVKAFSESNSKTELREYTEDIPIYIINMLENADKKQYGFHEIIKTNLYCIFISMLRITTKLKENDGRDEKEKSDLRFKTIRKFISDNIKNGITADDIARQFSMSKKQLSRICQMSSGMAVGELKRTIQIEKVKRYIEEGALSQKEIAERTGFADEFTMGKAFKRVEGQSPGEYRKSIMPQK